MTRSSGGGALAVSLVFSEKGKAFGPYRATWNIAEASLSPSAYSLIADYFPPHRRGFALGIYSMGIYIGSGLSYILGALVAQLAGAEANVALPVVGEVRPWQMVFFMIGTSLLTRTPRS
jgi:MFS family permease